MALFMDVHSIEGGITADAVAKARRADLRTQGRHRVSYLRYWVAEDAGRFFCLVDAASAEDARIVHQEAHGLVAQEIYEVSEHN